MKSQLNRLPDEEWKFSDIASNHLVKAFFYEYVRQSDRLIEQVALIRNLRKYHDVEELSGEWIPRQDLTEEQLAEIKKMESCFKKNYEILFLIWLSDCESFPHKPFTHLEPEEIRTPYDFLFDVPGIMDVAHARYENADDTTFTGLFGDYDHDEMEELGWENTHCLHLLCIDWRKTDTELKREFTDWLKTSRERLGIKSSSTAMRGIINRKIELPKQCKKMSTALAHLGKLRCFEDAGSWNNYLDIYIESDNPNRRDHEKDVKAARDIIKWMESHFIPRGKIK